MRKRIGVISHDAGGAELVSLHIRDMESEFLFCVAGPAVNIFKKNLGEFKNEELDNVIKRSSYIICGTSWQSTLENRAIALAKSQNIRVVSVLDHYSNYVHRYLKSGYTDLPDEIWVTDAVSQALAYKVAPNAYIKIVGNPYLEEVKRQYSAITKKPAQANEFSILYLTEPFTSHARIQFGDINGWAFNEYNALDYFIDSFQSLCNVEKIQITIRNHPAEEHNKYAGYIGSRKGMEIVLSAEPSLIVDIATNDALAGCDTMALMVGVTLGKTVYSSLPPFAGEPSLPSEGIIYLRDVLKE